jgi:uncharacterized protein (TIGR03086 family)
VLAADVAFVQSPGGAGRDAGSMDHADHLGKSLDLAVAAVRGLRPGQDDGAPTPCRDFTVAQVVDHLAFALSLAHRAGTREPWPQEWAFDAPAPILAGVAPDGRAVAFAREAAATARAWAEPRAWEGETHIGGSPMPAAAVGAMMTAEFALHGWDLAAATGQTLDVPPELGAAVLAAVGQIAQMGRDGGWFGPEVPLPADAPAFERALAASGRDPRWTP